MYNCAEGTCSARRLEVYDPLLVLTLLRSRVVAEEAKQHLTHTAIMPCNKEHSVFLHMQVALCTPKNMGSSVMETPEGVVILEII